MNVPVYLKYGDREVQVNSLVRQGDYIEVLSEGEVRETDMVLVEKVIHQVCYDRILLEGAIVDRFTQSEKDGSE